MNEKFYKYLGVSFLFLGMCFFILFVIGFVKNCTNIPFGDMWHIIDLYSDYNQWNLSKLFRVHNEHPIFLSNLLFFLNFIVFSGSVCTLQIFNAVLICIVILLSFHIGIIGYKIVNCPAKSSVYNQNSHTNNPNHFKHDENDNLFWLKLSCLGFCVILNCFWGTEENINWEFESQWYFSVIFPLLSILFILQNCYLGKTRQLTFWLAVIAMFLTSFTMMNGVLFVVLSTFVVLLNRFSVKQKIAWSVFAIMSLIFVLMVKENTRLYPQCGFFEIFKYFLLYIGSVGYYISKGFEKYLHINNYNIAYFFGIVYLSSFLIFVYKVYKAYKNKQMHDFLVLSFLLSFSLYFLGTAAVTSLGRVFLGVETATSSRYVTIGCAAWTVLFVLWMLFFNKKLVLSIILLFSLTMLPYQFYARHSTSGYFEKNTAALALTLGNMPDQTSFIYPWYDFINKSIQFLKTNHLLFLSSDSEISQMVQRFKEHKAFEKEFVNKDIECAITDEKIENSFSVITAHIGQKIGFSAMDGRLQQIYSLGDDNVVTGVGYYDRSNRNFKLFMDRNMVTNSKIYYALPLINTKFKCAHFKNIGNNIMNNNKVYGRQVGTDAFIQSFSSDQNVLIYNIELLLATLGKKNEGISHLSLRECSGRTLKTVSFENQSVADNEFRKFEEFRNMFIEAGKEYCLVLTSDGTSDGNGITWWVSTGNVFPSGKSKYKNADDQDDFIFNLFVEKH